MDLAERNLSWAQALVQGLVRSGVDRVVLSPGSRSTPLVLACLAEQGLTRHVVQDERSACFFALGLGKCSSSPAAVIATSGSAPANWYPAVLEASQDARPLLLISADRPAELQACGANQSVEQGYLFGAHVRAFMGLPEADDSPAALDYVYDTAVRAVDLAHWPRPGPVHINVPLREPLVPAEVRPHAVTVRGRPQPVCPQLVPAPHPLQGLARWLSGRRGLIVCGRWQVQAGIAEALSALASRLEAPVLADPLSGLRYGGHDRSRVVSRYDAFLRCRHFTRGHRPDWVLRFGALPISRSLQGYLESIPAEAQALIVPFGPWPDPSHQVQRVWHVDPSALCTGLLGQSLKPAPGGWVRSFLEQERFAMGCLGDGPVPLEAEVLEELGRLCPSGTRIFCGNSMVIRDVDSFFCGAEARLYLVGNRGLSGIDGNVSTVLGLAAAAEGPVVGLLGDLALYHDMNGLLAASGLSATLVVFNNGGGAIFGYLPQARLAGFERYWLTPTGLEMAQIARLYALGHHRVHDVRAFRHALSASLGSPGVDLIEVVVDRQESLRRHLAYWSRVTS
jgi:2-succinyl-5-enolpyruvyl-6-hydroxy-3-cyclohexene-1-carboxylate synthase